MHCPTPPPSPLTKGENSSPRCYGKWDWMAQLGLIYHQQLCLWLSVCLCLSPCLFLCLSLCLSVSLCLKGFLTLGIVSQSKPVMENHYPFLSLTHSFTNSLTPMLTHSVTQLLDHSRAQSKVTNSLTYWLSHSLTHLAKSGWASEILKSFSNFSVNLAVFAKQQVF